MPLTQIALSMLIGQQKDFKFKRFLIFKALKYYGSNSVIIGYLCKGNVIELIHPGTFGACLNKFLKCMKGK